MLDRNSDTAATTKARDHKARLIRWKTGRREPSPTSRIIWAIAYVPIAILIDFLAVCILQVGFVNRASRFQFSQVVDSVKGFVLKLFVEHNAVILLNMFLVGLVFVILLMLINRFWISSALLLIIAAFIGLAEYLKVTVRYEAILPADLNFLKMDAGNVASFLSPSARKTILFVGLIALIIVILTVMIHIADARHGRIVMTSSKLLGAGIRAGAFIVSSLFLLLFTLSVSTVGSWAERVTVAFGDQPYRWDSVYDSQSNGAFLTFLRALKPKIMDRPDAYSEETMRAIARKYAQEAEAINQTRANNLEDNTVILLLSESFADPQRVPGVKLNQESIPLIKKIKEQNDSGLMLSSGYGGVTANLEYMALTGMSMALFDSSLSSPYLQMIPNASWAPTFNRLWPTSKNNVAYHPYEPSLYARLRNYKKFGFSHFYNIEGPDVIPHQGKIGKNPYVSDAETYKSILETAKSTSGSNFIQVVTMQNHMPYTNWYTDNPFKLVGEGANAIPDEEKTTIQEYADGIHYTDQSTQDFLNDLEGLQKPVTVIFYGDHLPGIYNTAAADKKNAVTLHLTDYFIWSNSATHRAQQPTKTNQYTSPNFFMAQTAEHLNAKVTPLLAFLTRLHEHVAAMEPPVLNSIQKWERIPDGQAIYLDKEGNRFNLETADEQTRQLMNDYRLIQYDITAGNGYLKKWNFVDM